MANYTDLVRDLRSGLEDMVLDSRGMSKLRAYLNSYVISPAFEELTRSTAQVIDSLDRVRFRIVMGMGQIVVAPAEQEGTYNEQMATVFARFQDEDHHERESGKQEKDPGITHVAAGIVALAARMEPQPFTGLEDHCRRYVNFRDATLVGFAREAGFYLRYLDQIAPLEESGLLVSRPVISTDGKRLQARDSFDIALALQLVAQEDEVVTNDADLDGPERVLVITGAAVAHNARDRHPTKSPCTERVVHLNQPPGRPWRDTRKCVG